MALALFLLQFAVPSALYGNVRASSVGFVLSAFAGTIFLFTLATTRSGLIRVLGAALLGAAWSANLLVYRYYHVFLNEQLAASAVHSAHEVYEVARVDLPWLVGATLAIGCAEWAIMRQVPNRASSVHVGFAAIVLVAIALSNVHPENFTIEARTVRAIARLRSRSQARSAGEIVTPPLVGRNPKPPNVLFVLTESVRADSYCSTRREDCRFTPEIDRILPSRIALGDMRSVASYTSLAFNALLTGRVQTEHKSVLLSSPTLFHALRAIEGPTRPTTAYWSAQAAEVFERDDARRFVDSWASLETLLGYSVPDEDAVISLGLDQKLERYVSDHIGELASPYFLFTHFAGTHAPYYVNPSDAPFAPWGSEVSWGKLGELKNAYLNAVHEQDKAIANVVRTFLERQHGSPWVIVFTSDHGEAFGEHSAIHHGQNLFDEQLRVPAWIAASDDALSPSQRGRLAALNGRATTHLDLFPTVLDLYGIENTEALKELRRSQGGTSLVGDSPLGTPIPVTNCTELFPCPLNTWGMLGPQEKWIAQPWDSDFHCLSLSPTEHEAPSERCASLRAAGISTYPRMPNGRAVK